MEKKVVVMSAQDVAEMRRAKKEAEVAYFDAKVGALEFAAKEMRETHREYTLSELSAMTGLSTMELVLQLGANCRAASVAGIRRNEVRTGRQESIRQYVEVMPNGEVNPNSTLNVRRVLTTFAIPANRR